MPSLLARAPIARKLMAVMLLTTGVVLLLVGAAFATYDLLTFRQETVQNVATLGRVIAANSSAALIFDDRKDARDTLATLREDRQIVAAALYDTAGRVFAVYPAGLSHASLPQRLRHSGRELHDGLLLMFEPVADASRHQVGTLYLRADMQGTYRHLRLYLGMAAVMLAAAFLVAVLLSRKFQRQISEPILSLAHAASMVSEHRDYSVRAASAEQPELRVLTDAFNHMLGQIQQAQNGLKAQLWRLDLLQRITRAIGERQDLPSIFQTLVASLESDLPIDLGCMCSYLPDEQMLTVVSVGNRGRARAHRMGIEPQTCIKLDTPLPCVRGELVHIPDLRQTQMPLAQKLLAGGLRALVIAPLVSDDKVLGVLLVARTAPDSFSSGDCEFLRQLSEHVALAVNQASLYAQLQHAFDDLRRSQLTLSQQERLRALGQMASGIAHDINNAISPVALYTESLLESENALSERGRGQLLTIRHAIADVAQTVARMREFYRRRKPQETLLPVEVNALVSQVVDLTRARWSDDPHEGGVSVDLQMDLAAQPLFVLGSDGEIRDALINLVFNAVDAMPEGGQLTLRTRESAQEPRSVIIEVSDSGVGMDEETLRRCMEPFFTTKGERGTGMGLATVYGMARRNGAQVDVRSAVGEGTHVTLTFPLSEVAAAVERPRQSRGPARHLNLLVIDDDPLLILSLRDILEAEGHTVTVADGGQAGIDAFVSAQALGRAVDLVITDLGMPHLDGRAVAASIKALAPQTPVVLLTGWGHRLLVENEVPAHVDRLLSKPPQLTELRAALADLAPPADHNT